VGPSLTRASKISSRSCFPLSSFGRGFPVGLRLRRLLGRRGAGRSAIAENFEGRDLDTFDEARSPPRLPKPEGEGAGKPRRKKKKEKHDRRKIFEALVKLGTRPCTQVVGRGSDQFAPSRWPRPKPIFFKNLTEFLTAGDDTQ